MSAPSRNRRTLSRDAESSGAANWSADATPVRSSSDSASFTSVVRGSRGLGNPDRFATHLDDQRLRDRAQLVRRSDPERRTHQSVDVLGPAGERHDRMQREGDDAACRRWVEHGDALGARRVGHHLTALTATTSWPARRSAAPRALPTRPEPTMPTWSRAGRMEDMGSK